MLLYFPADGKDIINKDEIIVFGTENRSNTKRRKLDVDNIDILKDSNDGVKDDIESELEDNGHDVDFLLDPLCTYCPKLAPSGYMNLFNLLSLARLKSLDFLNWFWDFIQV